jgi:hypothetical protein
MKQDVAKQCLTAEMSCSQPTLDEARKGKLFLALSGRTSALHAVSSIH